MPASGRKWYRRIGTDSRPTEEGARLPRTFARARGYVGAAWGSLDGKGCCPVSRDSEIRRISRKRCGLSKPGKIQGASACQGWDAASHHLIPEPATELGTRLLECEQVPYRQTTI